MISIVIRNRNDPVAAPKISAILPLLFFKSDSVKLLFQLELGLNKSFTHLLISVEQNATAVVFPLQTTLSGLREMQSTMCVSLPKQGITLMYI